jgi:hypothetical protein
MSIDIEHYHYELRAILDYVAIALTGLANKPKQAEIDSIEELYNWLNRNPGNINRLGKEASAIVQSAVWYKEIRMIRDMIIHHGANTLVFCSPNEGILFQIMKGWNKIVYNEALMWNENVLDFELYAGLYFAKAFILIKQIGDLVQERLKEIVNIGDITTNYSGIEVLANWIGRLVQKLESQQ